MGNAVLLSLLWFIKSIQNLSALLSLNQYVSYDEQSFPTASCKLPRIIPFNTDNLKLP